MNKSESCGKIAFEDDLKYEETEELTLSLSLSGQPGSRIKLAQDTTTVLIIDDDGERSCGVSVHGVQCNLSILDASAPCLFMVWKHIAKTVTFCVPS